jgi:hypothetical protein
MLKELSITKDEQSLLKLVLMDTYVNSKTYYFESEKESMIEIYEKLSELFEEEENVSV